MIFKWVWSPDVDPARFFLWDFTNSLIKKSPIDEHLFAMPAVRADSKAEIAGFITNGRKGAY